MSGFDLIKGVKGFTFISDLGKKQSDKMNKSIEKTFTKDPELKDKFIKEVSKIKQVKSSFMNEESIRSIFGFEMGTEGLIMDLLLKQKLSNESKIHFTSGLVTIFQEYLGP